MIDDFVFVFQTSTNCLDRGSYWSEEKVRLGASGLL